MYVYITIVSYFIVTVIFIYGLFMQNLSQLNKNPCFMVSVFPLDMGKMKKRSCSVY